ncbi:MAG: hypothetical protein A2X19_08425 [Bacteroidetes bacterium GWE2_39_28]|nr:MAG: hypothetical protein A2X19_08425 [Bacteroidetes bacterium GWE2_39_28]OFY14652.1 MAG: hypothetical protein A2X16_02280 [Bacteroidetes bacterium GWF2_39_10]OFZ08934.1 MAG: hypothetical protein A2322_01835 [Bacteroidetes bacterium RIFOXYB2_FULL_39_7]HCT93640.1 hypothetical protein [Rikenellaceae bacterium]
MYSKFKVKKGIGTYSDTIEAFGLANLLNEIQSRTELNRPKLWIEDKGLYYELTSRPEIHLEQIQKLNYFPLFQYVVRDSSGTFDEIFFDYPKQRDLKKERQELTQKAFKEFAGKDKSDQLKQKIKEIERIYSEEKKIYPELDVYSQVITPNNFVGFDKLYRNISSNKEAFPEIVKAILDYYSDFIVELKPKALNSFDDTVTALQIYNPTTGKGQNKGKASGASAGPIKLNWISETMKTSGALTNMLCQLVKVGSSYDMKVVVPDFKKAEYTLQRQIVLSFKKNIKGNTPLKVDILNLLILNKQLIENTEEYKSFKARNIITGLHSTYQKDLGQNKAVVNISKLQTPDFIEFDNEDEAKDWVELLKEQINIIGSIEELGDATQGLIAYRTFLTSSHFSSWARFIFWYAEHIMSNFSRKKYALPFKVTSLNKFFKNMNMTEFKIYEIISNEGFQKVAYAIRKSTVTLQYTPKDQRKFEIRYGLAQSLQNKSKSASDLAGFIGQFIATFNAETARYAEKNGTVLRANIRENELSLFYGLLDKYPSKVVGALLASYGFALTEKEANKAGIEGLIEGEESPE